VSTPEAAVAPIPVEAPELESRLVSLGSYLLSAATTFFFISFLFAFFYLRALNSNGLWAGPKPGHHVPTTLTSGIAILACVLASAVLARVALAELRGRGRPLWWPAAAAALLLGLAAVAIQCWQYTDLAFGTSEGGYASVYLGWTGFFTIFAFGAMLWLETILATARRTALGPTARPGPDLASFSIFWTTLGLVEIAAFVLLYGVK
jgi:heme/copper-type cytochrome/quinol oxidase subunit 3